MEKNWVSPEVHIQSLQRRENELERQRADSQSGLKLRTNQQENSYRSHSDLQFANHRDIILLIRRGDGRILDANPAARRMRVMVNGLLQLSRVNRLDD